MLTLNDDLLPAEIDILNKLTNIELDFSAMTVVTNLYRAVQAMRVKMEQEVLSKYNLSWTAFSMLYNLWIWNAMETRSLAKSMGVTVATVSSVANTMEKRGLVQRSVDPNDRRLVLLSLTDEGKNVMDELFPDFNRKESEIVAGLSEDDLAYLARMLRRINKNILALD